MLTFRIGPRLDATFAPVCVVHGLSQVMPLGSIAYGGLDVPRTRLFPSLDGDGGRAYGRYGHHSWAGVYIGRRPVIRREALRSTPPGHGAASGRCADIAPKV